MACTTARATQNCYFKVHSGLQVHRNQARTMPRTYSYNYLCYSINHFHESSTEPILKTRSNMGMASNCNCEENESGCELSYDSEDGGEERFNSESFSKLLVEVGWSDTKLYSKLAFLCNMAYNIPHIKDDHLRRYYGLQFVTSSLEKKADAEETLKAKLDQEKHKQPARDEEEEKLEAARDIQLFHSSPYEWFSCDDTTAYTHFFVIQGSYSLASWQVNSVFEPAKFEGTDTLVHRGIYEAAKGMYQQFMPDILDHLNRYGDRAKLQFTGHCFGGSLALLLNLMLLTRKVVKTSSLLPVVTFGSPFVLCGGQKLLCELGVDEKHVHNVIMHRDIVPRAFSCTYPDHVSRAVESIKSFSSHPCLIQNKLLYSPLGKVFILQPDKKSSQQHPLLPPGSGLYALEDSGIKQFLNDPHPIQTLTDPSAYCWDGTIVRDHDSSNYLKAVNGILRQHRKRVVWKVMKTQRNPVWPLVDWTGV